LGAPSRDYAPGGAADLSGRQNQHKEDDKHQHVGVVADHSDALYCFVSEMYPPGPDPLIGEGCLRTC
jgi:hypothetical protein